MVLSLEEKGLPLVKMQPQSAMESGIIHGFKCYMLKDEKGEVAATHSIAAGLDYPGVGPEHCYLKASGRAQYLTISDEEALEAFHLLSKVEGIIPALESSHAVAQAIKWLLNYG